MLHPLLSRRVEVLHCRGRKCAVAVSPHVGNIMMVSTQSLQALACSTTSSTVVWRCSTAGDSECAFRSNVKKQKATNTLWALQSLARTTAALVSSVVGTAIVGTHHSCTGLVAADRKNRHFFHVVHIQRVSRIHLTLHTTNPLVGRDALSFTAHATS
jgi:hypothetical protein